MRRALALAACLLASHTPSPCHPSPAPSQTSLYAEAASWTNPEQLEEQLARAAEKRKKPVSAQELRHIMDHKRALKKQKQTGWLYT